MCIRDSSYNVRIIGIPPRTDASKRRSTPFLLAKSNKYGPASANKSLFAVTTFFLAFKAPSTPVSYTHLSIAEPTSSMPLKSI